MATCVIQCSNVYPDAAGRRLVAPMEYETLGMCGSNLGIGDPDAVARINRLCNELGLDTIEVGAALGVAAEAGVWAFGDAERAIALVEEIGQGTVLGRLLGQGCYIVGRTLGVRRIPAVKRQAISAYDPRAVKGTGVTYATSPMGGDHTVGLTVFAPVDHHDRQGQVALSRGTQITRAAYDALGLCVFLLGSTAARPELITDMLAAAYGVPVPPAYLAEMGRRVIDLEREFNRRAGLTEATDRLPDFFSARPWGRAAGSGMCRMRNWTGYGAERCGSVFCQCARSPGRIVHAGCGSQIGPANPCPLLQHRGRPGGQAGGGAVGS